MSENKKNTNETNNEVRGSRASFLIVCVIAIALAVAVVIMGLHMSGVFGGSSNSSSASQSSAAESSAISSASERSSKASSGSASISSASSGAASSSNGSSSQAPLPSMDEGGQDKAYSEISPVIAYISKTAQPGTMGADERITMCAARLLDTLYSSKCSAADFKEAALSYKEENGISNDLREQLLSVLKASASFSDETAAKKALNGTGITSKSPWDDKTFEKLFSLGEGLGLSSTLGR